MLFFDLFGGFSGTFIEEEEVGVQPDDRRLPHPCTGGRSRSTAGVWIPRTWNFLRKRTNCDTTSVMAASTLREAFKNKNDETYGIFHMLVIGSCGS